MKEVDKKMRMMVDLKKVIVLKLICKSYLFAVTIINELCVCAISTISILSPTVSPVFFFFFFLSKAIYIDSEVKFNADNIGCGMLLTIFVQIDHLFDVLVGIFLHMI